MLDKIIRMYKDFRFLREIMLRSPFLEFIKENVPIDGNFRVGIPETLREILASNSSGQSVLDGRKIVLNFVLSNIVRPLLNSSVAVQFFQTEFKETSFRGEGGRLADLLDKLGSKKYSLKREVDAILSFENFWSGVEGDGSRRGYVLFLVEDGALDFRRLFSFCYEPAVVARSSLRSSFGSGLYKFISENVRLKPTQTVVVLGPSGSLDNLTIFSSEEFLIKRLEEAIESSREYDLARVGD